jgi:murein DD-endopeptidase MepM/ murein hydrolase activator NlpD
MRPLRNIFFFLSAFGLSLFAFSLTARADTAADQARIQQLQAQIDALESQAARYRSGVAAEHAKADSLGREVAILKGQIGMIQAQITATEAKIGKTQIEIGDVQERIGHTRETISRKRETIGRMISFLDRQDHENLLASLFKYANLSGFFQQLHDAARMQGQVIAVIDELKDTKAELEADQGELLSKQAGLEELKGEAAQRKAALDGTKYQKDKLLRDTKGQEAQYQRQVAEVEKQKAALFTQMRELELKVISGGLYVVHIKADTIPPRGTKLFAMPEDNAHLTQGYGMTTYARRGAYGGAPHNGVDMAAGYGAPIKAIGDGLIVANGTNSAWGNWVAIQHPNNMTSVYAHMSSLSSLKVGSQVHTGQIIGYEGNTGKVTGSHLHLSLYREFFTYIKDKDGQLYFNYFEGSVNPMDYL